MKTVGIVGGIGPESTIEYYRSILAEYRLRRPDGTAPSILIDSIDVQKLLALAGAGAFDELVAYLLPELTRLARAGADFAAFASNTPHIVFDQLQRETPLPLVSIVDAAADEVAAEGMRKVTLFGTKFTMSGTFYPEIFSRRDIEVVPPDPASQAFIHEKYIGELLYNILLPETRDALLAIVDNLRESHAIEGVVLAGTELPLILRQEHHNGVRLFDTTAIHVRRIVTELLGGG